MWRKHLTKLPIFALLFVVLLVSACQGNQKAPAPQPDVQTDQVLRVIIAQNNLSPLQQENADSPALVSLGEALFFDRELSGNRDISCATCHHPRFQSSDGLAVPIGTGGQGLGTERKLGYAGHLIPRNSPDVFNRGLSEFETMFWDSRVAGSLQTGFSSPAGEALPQSLDNVLAIQAMFPVTSRDEMRGQMGDTDLYGQANELAQFEDTDFQGIWNGIMARLLAIPEYQQMFQAAYPNIPQNSLGFEHAAEAIAAFEAQAFTFTDSPWDRYLAGDDDAMTPDAKAGALIFYGKAGCAQCHSGNLFTDQAHHNIAVPQLGPGKGAEAPLDFGRARETNNEAERFAFRTPPLRNVAITGPWMHNGAYADINEAVKHHLNPQQALYNYDPSQLSPEMQKTVQNNPELLAQILQTIDPLVASPRLLSPTEFDQLMVFLCALTSPSAISAQNKIPARVPSGLPVDNAPQMTQMLEETGQ